MESIDEVLIVGLIVYILLNVAATAIYRRGKKVSAFLHAVLELYNKHLEANIDYYAQSPHSLFKTFPTFVQLTFSRKELTLENYFSKEDIDLLYNYDLANTAHAKQ